MITIFARVEIDPKLATQQLPFVDRAIHIINYPDGPLLKEIELHADDEFISSETWGCGKLIEVSNYHEDIKYDENGLMYYRDIFQNDDDVNIDWKQGRILFLIGGKFATIETYNEYLKKQRDAVINSLGYATGNI